MTQNEVWDLIHSDDQPLLIDSRSYDSFLDGHIPTAISIPFTGEVSQEDIIYINSLNSLNYEKIIIYCSCTNGLNAESMANDLESSVSSEISYMSDNFLYWSYEKISGSERGNVSFDTTNSKSTNYSPPDISAPILLFNISAIILIIFIFIRRRK